MIINTHARAVWLLLLVCVIWGGMFVLVDQAIEHLPVHSFNALRFAVAALCLWPLWCLDREGKERRVSGKLLQTSGLLALIMFISYATQTVGLQYTTVSNAGFITGLCVPLVPVLGVLIYRVAVPPITWLGVSGATAGIYFLTMGDHQTFNKGDSLMLVCAVSFAFHIVITGRVASKFPVIPLCTLQMAAVSLYSAVAALVSEPLGMQVWRALNQPVVLTTILVSGTLATALAFWSQTASQRLLEPYKVGLIFATEPLFAHIAAALFLGERLGLWGWFGAGLIIGGMLVTELGDRKHTPKMQPADMNAAPDFNGMKPMGQNGAK